MTNFWEFVRKTFDVDGLSIFDLKPGEIFFLLFLGWK